ncbi:MAG: cellulase family glycosylhydrolase [bacterium]|nr:cellulase family glycosylhydrolase [bacterium]
MKFILLLIIVFTSSFASAVPNTLEGILPEKNVPLNVLGVNAFVNDSRFGTINYQLLEVKNTLGINFVRVLFNWDDNVQPTPSSQPDFSFYDDIIDAIPKHMKVLIILTKVPSWMSDSSNWIDNNPRKTFVERWVKVVINRYKNIKKKRVKAFQIWNEPNDENNPDNSTLDIVYSPENYLELLALSYDTIKEVAQKKQVVNAATTAINQNYPETYNYNQELVDAGLLTVSDFFSIHYYGSHLENLLLGGVGDFLNSVEKPIWITESGAKGTTKQLEYARTMWPFLLEFVPGIKRIYQYQFTEASSSNSTYGLKNLTPGKTISDLYIYLRENN